MTILDQLAAHARKRVAAYKAVLPLEEVRRQCEALPKGSFALDTARCGRPSAYTGLRTRPRPTPLRRRRSYWTPAAAAAKPLTGPCSPQSAARTFWRAALGPKPSPPR